MITVLAGGLGAARFLRGLVQVVPAGEITVIGNTGDDIDIYGVHVSPDLDIVTFMLGGVLDLERQFGIEGDTHTVMDELRAQGADTWFALGDQDYSVCLARTLWLRDGITLSECTARIAGRFGVEVRILPMTDAAVHTVVDTEHGEMHFQEYWVRHRAAPAVRSVRLQGACAPAPGVLEAIGEADTVIVAPSNPVVSIGTILSVPGIRDALRSTSAPVVGVSPIVGGRVVRGMADKLLPAIGTEISAAGVARLYADLLDAFVIDLEDAGSIDAFTVPVEATDTMMHDALDAARVAKATLALAERIRNS